MSDIRFREAAATGADVLVTTCPLCLVMLTDAGATSGLDEPPRVLDLNELVLRALGSTCDAPGSVSDGRDDPDVNGHNDDRDGRSSRREQA